MPRGRISALSLDFTRFEIVHAYRLPRHLRLSLGFWSLACLPLGFWSLARLSLGF